MPPGTNSTARPSGFLGELDLLSGRPVRRAHWQPSMRYIAVERPACARSSPRTARSAISVLSTFIARREALQSGARGRPGDRRAVRSGADAVGSSNARANRLPQTWEDATPVGGGELPLVRLPGAELSCAVRARPGVLALSDRARARPSRRGRLADRRSRPAGLGGGGVRRLRRSRHAGHREHGTRRSGGPVPTDRELPWVPAGTSGTELTSRAVTQARKFNARTAMPIAPFALEPEKRRHRAGWDDDRRGRRACRPACDGSPVPVGFRSPTSKSSRD